MTKRDQMLECRRKMDEGMMVVGTADHLFQVDVLQLLWWLLKTALLLLDRQIAQTK